jgi:uroporphyrin-3 C-methyltransferase
MSEPNQTETPEGAVPPDEAGADKPATAPSRALVFLWLAAGLALLGVLALGWLAWQDKARIDTTRQELARRLADGESAQRETQAYARQNREGLDALQAKVGALEAQLAEMRSQQLALEAIYQELSRVREDRLLAEIEQGVAIAAQQLQLAGNVEAALIALQGADARLAQSNQPQFLPLRKLISRDIEKLRALPGADVPGIALRLDVILNGLASMPLAFEQRPTPAPAKPGKPKKEAPPPVPAAAPASPPAAVAEGWAGWQAAARAWAGDIWQELRQLVRIERIDRPDPGLLAPREVFFLRENLRLRLLSARLALLARDGRSFQADLKQAAAWIEQYFDARAPAVQEALAELKALGKLEVMRETMELNETLSALRNFKLSRDRGR